MHNLKIDYFIIDFPIVFKNAWIVPKSIFNFLLPLVECYKLILFKKYQTICQILQRYFPWHCEVYYYHKCYICINTGPKKFYQDQNCETERIFQESGMIDSFIQQIYVESLLYARHWLRHWNTMVNSAPSFCLWVT